MSKYEVLATTAIESMRRHFQMGDECTSLATRMGLSIANYLECPHDSMFYVEIKTDLNCGPQKIEVRGHRPTLTYARDGFWYFGLNFHFSLPTNDEFLELSVLYGLKKQANNFILRRNTDVSIDVSEAEFFSVNNEELYNRLLKNCSHEDAADSKKIGFAI